MSGKLHRNPPFRAEHLGSLLRTEALLKKRAEVDRKEAPVSELKELEDKDIKDIVDTQLKLGYSAITDGEYRRHMFWGTFFPGLDGFEEIQNPDPEIFRMYVPDIAAFTESGHKPGETVICTGKIKHVGSTYVDQFKYLASLVPPEQVKNLKITLAAPNWYHLRYKEGRAYPKEVYSSDEEYFADIAKAYQEELQILYDAGCRNVQYDDPNLAYFCSEKMIAGWNADPLNKYSVDDLLDKYIKLYNDCLAKRPADMHVGVHLCRGNFVNSRHFSEGGYDRIAVKLFKELNVDTYYLEYDTPRAGGFEPLRELPKHKNVILGVVTSKFPQLEDKEEMKKRIFAAAEFIAQGNNETVEESLKRVGVSPQCGFASHSSGNAIDHDSMIAKLKLVREIANDIWPGEP
ncbi:methionine synthase, vitamin-B12 independent [Thermoascus aurantiacus ATCC 26904]